MSTTIKTIMLSMFLISNLMFASTPLAAMLAWDATPDTVDGYRIHYGTDASNLDQLIDVGTATTCDLNHLPLSENIHYYFSVSAYNSAGSSPPTQIIEFTPADNTPPSPPIGFELVPPQ